MGNEPGRLTTKHLDKNHVFESQNMGLKSKPNPSNSNFSIQGSQKSLNSQPVSKEPDLSKFFEIANTMTFIQNYSEFNCAYKANLGITLPSGLILNEDDLETPPFNRDTFGGYRGPRFDKRTVIKFETLSSKNLTFETLPAKNEKNLIIDLKISKISQNVRPPPLKEHLLKRKEPVKKIFEEPVQISTPPQITKEPSVLSSQSEDRKSPQFLTKTSEDFQTANFTGLQNYLIAKSKERKKSIGNQERISSNPLQTFAQKASSENRIPTPKPRKTSKTESEFSDFSNRSCSDLNKKPDPSLSQTKPKSPLKSPIKSTQIVKTTNRDVFNFKKDKPGSARNIEENKDVSQSGKKSVNPNMKPPRLEVAKSGSKTPNNRGAKDTGIKDFVSNPKYAKKNSHPVNTINNNENGSSEEEPLHIKISLDLKKFNKNANNRMSKEKEEENSDDKELVNNQFLKSVVKDIDKLTQKMLNTNLNLSGMNTSQGLEFLILRKPRFLKKASENLKKTEKKSYNEVVFSSNQQSETSESDYGRFKPIVMKKK